MIPTHICPPDQQPPAYPTSQFSAVRFPSRLAKAPFPHTKWNYFSRSAVLWQVTSYVSIVSRVRELIEGGSLPIVFSGRRYTMNFSSFLARRLRYAAPPLLAILLTIALAAPALAQQTPPSAPGGPPSNPAQNQPSANPPVDPPSSPPSNPPGTSTTDPTTDPMTDPMTDR